MVISANKDYIADAKIFHFGTLSMTHEGVEAATVEALKIAKENTVFLLFEASVGGGIPVIAPLKDCFTGDDILRVADILNGTTNYILTHMQSEGKSLEEALKTAQELGYAEADPHADLAGLDSARKIAILAGIEAVDTRAEMLQYDDLLSNSLDPYSQMRDFYLLNAEKQVSGKIEMATVEEATPEDLESFMDEIDE